MVLEEVKKLFAYLPNNGRLEEALAEIFAGTFPGESPVRLVNREMNIYTSTHPSEIVWCQFPEGIERRFFLKYEIETHSILNDHRKTLDYEIRVYRDVLTPVAMSTPRYYGSYTFEESNLRLLVIEYFSDLVKFSKSKDEPNIILKAARWLGEFHNRSKDWLERDGAAFLHRYDEDYYLKWTQITLDHIAENHLDEQFQWLMDLIDRFRSCLGELTGADPVVIHGEFYPTNVRYAHGTIYPLDWQTAALCPGEIDIASLTHFWPDREIMERALEEYRTVRGLSEPKENFRRRVLLATVYLNFLWLKYHPLAIHQGKGVKFLDNLKELQPLI